MRIRRECCAPMVGDEPAINATTTVLATPGALPETTQPSAAAKPVEESPSADAPLSTSRYEVREMIGRGGSGVVLRAFDRSLLREVAIKVLDPALTDTISDVDRFLEEARINGQLEHPAIVPVYDLGVDDRGRRFLSMKLVHGTTLQETLSRLGHARLEPVHLAELLQVFVRACEAVAFAHSHDVIHRDIKPTNLMISDFGQVYVLDWGIARLRGGQSDRSDSRVRISPDGSPPLDSDPPGAVVGTFCYAAPEQLLGQHDRIDERTDVFALGATLYQILTGQPPLSGRSVRAVWLGEALTIDPPDAVASSHRVPAELSRIAMRALSAAPDDRHPSVLALKAEVEAFLRGSWDLPRETHVAGSVILREGEPGETAYVIVEGRCIAYRGGDAEAVSLRVMGPGDVFGEAAIFANKPRSASVRAETDVVLIVVTREVLSNALGLGSWMGAFVRTLAERFREVDERLRAVGRSPEAKPRS